MRYVQVAAQIAERIGAGDLTGGQRLPARRELARQYRASNSTVRKALDELTQQGLIVTVQGRAFVACQSGNSSSRNSSFRNKSGRRRTSS